MAKVAVIVSNPCTEDARVIKIAHAARDAGHEVHVFARADNKAPPYEKLDGIVYHRLEWNPSRALSEGLLARILSRLHRKLGAAWVKLLQPFLRYRTFSDVFHEQVAALKPDLIHAHDLICLPTAFDASALCGAPVIYDAHELEFYRYPLRPMLERLWVRHVERKYASRAAAVVTVGRLVRQELAKEIGRDDIQLVYNAPDILDTEHNIRTDLKLDEDQPLLLYVGKATVGRGIEEVIDVLPRLAGVMFAVVGPCSEAVRTELLQHAEKAKVQARFRILPPVPYKNVVGYIRGADAGIIRLDTVSLSYRYAMPNKLLEMSAANVPIIANELDEIAEFLRQFGNGITVDFERREAIVYQLSKFMAHAGRYRMSEDTYAAMMQEYSWQTQERRVAAIYNDVLARHDKKGH